MAASTDSSAATDAARTSSSGDVSAARLAALRQVKLTALIRDNLGVTGGDPVPFPGGAARVVDGHAYVYADEEPLRSLGRAVAFARQADIESGRLTVVVDEHPGALARRAAQLAQPPDIRWAVGRELHTVAQDPAPAIAAPDERALDLAPMLVEAGATVVIEQGVVRGEVLGLEIATVVAENAGARVEAGVGKHDREAFALLHGDLPPREALREVIDTVKRHRRAGAPDHPLQRLVPERWLREIVLADPSIAGASTLDRIEGTAPRASVKEVHPAAAAGVDASGASVVVSCSVGVDLDVVPAAADARAARAPEARLVIVVPERDALPVTHALAGMLRAPADVVAVANDWRSLAAT